MRGGRGCGWPVLLLGLLSLCTCTCMCVCAPFSTNVWYMYTCVCMPVCLAVFSPEFTGGRAQIISHDHTPHLECSDY